MEREQIIEYLTEFAREKPYVNAMWLEGADGIGRVDEYSDIDFWFDTEDGSRKSFLYECLEALSRLGRIDSRYDYIRADIVQSNIHLENTSEYLTLDICVQSSETRGLEATRYVKNDIAELPMIIFDKKGIFSFFDYQPDTEEIKREFEENKNRILQRGRVTKYIKRGRYLEAYMKYTENIAEPLVKIARLIYTPRHCGYVLCHISEHLPPEAVKELEPFFRIADFKDIEENLEKAVLMLEKYERILGLE